jgi:hypothetical protein
LCRAGQSNGSPYSLGFENGGRVDCACGSFLVLCRNRDYGSFEVRIDCKIDEVTKDTVMWLMGDKEQEHDAGV